MLRVAFVAFVAQLVEHMICNHEAAGSIPAESSLCSHRFSSVVEQCLYTTRVGGSNPSTGTINN